MQTLYLLDAYALIYRAYYALLRSPRINSKGQNTSAAYGFVNTLDDVIRTEKPDFIGIAFDPKGALSATRLTPNTRLNARPRPRTYGGQCP